MKTFLLCLFLGISLIANAADYAQLNRQVMELAQEKKYSEAIEVAKSAFLLREGKGSDLYNAACVAALGGQHDLAFEWLNRSFEKGMHNLDHVLADSDLDSLHSDPRWKDTIVHANAVITEAEKNYDKPLQKTLLEILKSDQADRLLVDQVVKKYGQDSQEVKNLWEKINAQDEINTEKIKKIINQYGWVGPELVGATASRALFFIIQHADSETRSQYLPLMREAVKNKKAFGSNLALLEDRTALESGKKQIYGSQVLLTKEGKFMLHSLEDPDHVDERRAEVGLMPLADYLKTWNLVWDVESYKKSVKE